MDKGSKGFSFQSVFGFPGKGQSHLQSCFTHCWWQTPCTCPSVPPGCPLTLGWLSPAMCTGWAQFHNKITRHFSKKGQIYSTTWKKKRETRPKIPFIYSGKWSMSKMIRTVIKQESQTHRLAQRGEGGSWRDSILNPEIFFSHCKPQGHLSLICCVTRSSAQKPLCLPGNESWAWGKGRANFLTENILHTETCRDPEIWASLQRGKKPIS